MYLKYSIFVKNMSDGDTVVSAMRWPYHCEGDGDGNAMEMLMGEECDSRGTLIALYDSPKLFWFSYFFDNFAKKNGFDPLIAENWYSVSTRSVTNEHVWFLFCFVLFSIVFFVPGREILGKMTTFL